MSGQAPCPRTRALVEQASAEVLKNAVDPRDDAAAERLKATFDPQELACLMADGAANLERR